MQFLLNAAVGANDLFDLRILPGFANSTVSVESQGSTLHQENFAVCEKP